MVSEYLLEMSGIDKSFAGVQVLHGVDFNLKPGEVHALMGENGAGKSTLMKILGGIYTKDAGTIYVDGKEEQIRNVEDAKKLGINIIHQEIFLADSLSVAENIYMGREITYAIKSFVNFEKIEQQAQTLLDAMHTAIRARDMVGDLSIAQQQMVEICRALSTNLRVLVMDEPTASLTDSEIEILFEQIERLKKQGIGIIYISHRMDEIEKIADRITVLRDGNYIGTIRHEDFSRDRLIQMMVGRTLKEFFIHTDENTRKIDGEILRVQNLSNSFLKDINFTLKRGEILGFSGLLGAGRTELARAIFGIDPIISGGIYLKGRKVNIRNAKDAIQNGIALVPEDRKKLGLFLSQTVSFNMTISVLEKFIKFLHIDRKKETQIVNQYINSLSVKMPGLQHAIEELSGGNQQKVVVSKWLAGNPEILILDEPTRGIDVGAKTEIYQLISEITKSGVSIILISSEMPEILNLSDRILVMHEGRISGELNQKEASQVKIMHYASGGE